MEPSKSRTCSKSGLLERPLFSYLGTTRHELPSSVHLSSECRDTCLTRVLEPCVPKGNVHLQQRHGRRCCQYYRPHPKHVPGSSDFLRKRNIGALTFISRWHEYMARVFSCLYVHVAISYLSGPSFACPPLRLINAPEPTCRPPHFVPCCVRSMEGPRHGCHVYSTCFHLQTIIVVQMAGVLVKEHISDRYYSSKDNERNSTRRSRIEKLTNGVVVEKTRYIRFTFLLRSPLQ